MKNGIKFVLGRIGIGGLLWETDYATYFCEFDLSLGFKGLKSLELKLLVVLLDHSIA